MIEEPEPDWAAIRCRYEETQDIIADICADAGIPKSRLETRRKRDKWRRKIPRPFPPPRGTLKAAPAPHPAPSPDCERVVSPAARRADAAVADEAAESAAPASPHGFAPRLVATPAARRRLLDRLVAAISMKLEQLERRMTNDLAAGEDSTATDHEREARAIGALIDNLDKITEIETGIGKSAGKSGVASTAAGLADEAERCRRELADRLHRIVEAAERSP